MKTDQSDPPGSEINIPNSSHVVSENS